MNRLIPILITAILLFTAHCAFSQGIWQTYTRVDGLAGDTVYCIAQDQIGNLWFGTWYNGISVLDTNGIITNLLNTDSSIYVIDIEIDNRNNKWLALYQTGGILPKGTYIVKFDDSTYTYYEPTGDAFDPPNPCCLGLDSLDQIWCGAGMFGLTYWFDGKEWHQYYVSGAGLYSSVNDIVMDRNGKLYFAHDRGIATFYEYLLWGWWTLDLAFDKQNRMWCAASSWMWGLAMFDGDNWYAHTEDDGLLEYSLRAVAVDSNNNIWISYANEIGISKFDGSTFKHFNQKDGLAHNQVWDIYVDRRGDIWFATTGGVSVLHDTTTATKITDKRTTEGMAAKFSLLQNYPNPFNPETEIRYQLPEAAYVSLAIYNLLGQKIRTLINQDMPTGFHSVKWDGKDDAGSGIASGMYIYALQAGSFHAIKKMVLMR